MNNARLDEHQIQRLLNALAQGSLRKKRRAVRIITWIPNPDRRLMAALVELLHCEDLRLRVKASAALARIGRPSVTALRAALAAEDPDFRRAVVLTLGQIGPAAHEAAGALRELTTDEELGRWAARALAQIEPASLWDRSSPRWWPWAVAAVLVFTFGLVTGHVAAIQAAGIVPGPALSASACLGGLCAVLGLVVGWQTGGLRRTLLLIVGFAIGGASAGLLLGWILAGLVGPVIKALGG